MRRRAVELLNRWCSETRTAVRPSNTEGYNLQDQRIKRGWPTCCAPTEPSSKFTTNCLAMTGGENGIPSRPKQRSLATVVEVVLKRCRNHVGVQWSDEIEGIETGLLRNSPISNFSSRRRRKDLTAQLVLCTGTKRVTRKLPELAPIHFLL